MTERHIAALMAEPEWNRMVMKIARRYASSIEDQEQYAQDALLRVAAKCSDTTCHDELKVEAARAIDAAYRRKRYVEKKRRDNLHSISRWALEKRCIDLGRGRLLDPVPEKMESWYYWPEWAELGLNPTCMQIKDFYRIILDGFDA
jgi:hypothetical protein